MDLYAMHLRNVITQITQIRISITQKLWALHNGQLADRTPAPSESLTSPGHEVSTRAVLPGVPAPRARY